MTEVFCDPRSFGAPSRSRIIARMAEVSDANLNVSPISRAAEVVLAVSYGKQTVSDERMWSFPSTVDSVVCRYLERWLPVDATAQQFTLRKRVLLPIRATGARNRSAGTPCVPLGAVASVGRWARSRSAASSPAYCRCSSTASKGALLRDAYSR